MATTETTRTRLALLATICCCLLLKGARSTSIAGEEGERELELARAKLLDSGPNRPASLAEISELVKLVAQTGAGAAQLEPGVRVELGQLEPLAEPGLAGCSESHIRSLVEQRSLYLGTAVQRFFADLIKRQRKFCEDYIDQEARQRIESLSSKASFYFRTILDSDRPGHDFYITTDNSITKLRSIAQALDIKTQREFSANFGDPFFSACREIVSSLAGLGRIWHDLEIFARLPLSAGNFFRVHDFCNNLVHFDLLDQIDSSLIYDVQMRTELIKFAHHLNGSALVFLIGKPTWAFGNGSTSAPSQPGQRMDLYARHLVTEAALGYALDYELDTRPGASAINNKERRNQRLNKKQLKIVHSALASLKDTCNSALQLTENLVWLVDFARLSPHGLVVADSDTERVSKQTRLNKCLSLVHACQLFVKIDAERVAIELQGRPEGELLKPRYFSDLWRSVSKLFKRNWFQRRADPNDGSGRGQ